MFLRDAAIFYHPAWGFFSRVTKARIVHASLFYLLYTLGRHSAKSFMFTLTSAFAKSISLISFVLTFIEQPN